MVYLKSCMGSRGRIFREVVICVISIFSSDFSRGGGG